MAYRFNRTEFAGSLGDLGVLLPMAMGMIMVNGLSPQGLFLAVGLFYILSGVYFGVPVSVQPMKVIGSYAIAMGLARDQILAAGLTTGVLLLAIGLTGTMSLISRLIPRPVIRGVQLSTGLLLMLQGMQMVLGKSSFQLQHKLAEPFLAIQGVGPVPLTWLLGAAALLLTFFFLKSPRFPAGLVVVGFGLLTGIILGNGVTRLSLFADLPSIMPAGLPSTASFVTAMLVLTLPQVPMTLGNAVIANVDLAQQYFGDEAKRTTGKALCVSMGLANLGSFLLGGMPMCHGAGGLAAHYRFGARTAGSNIMIGGLFTILALALGDSILGVTELMPMSVLGVLLFFAGSELAITVGDVKERKNLFVCLAVAGVTLASNLAVGFMTGAAVHFALRYRRMAI